MDLTGLYLVLFGVLLSGIVIGYIIGFDRGHKEGWEKGKEDTLWHFLPSVNWKNGKAVAYCPECGIQSNDK